MIVALPEFFSYFFVYDFTTFFIISSAKKGPGSISMYTYSAARIVSFYQSFKWKEFTRRYINQISLHLSFDAWQGAILGGSIFVYIVKLQRI